MTWDRLHIKSLIFYSKVTLFIIVMSKLGEKEHMIGFLKSSKPLISCSFTIRHALLHQSCYKRPSALVQASRLCWFWTFVTVACARTTMKLLSDHSLMSAFAHSSHLCLTTVFFFSILDAPLELPSFQMTPSQHQIVFQGDSLPFQCMASFVDEDMQVLWYQDGKMVEPDATQGIYIEKSMVQNCSLIAR